MKKVLSFVLLCIWLPSLLFSSQYYITEDQLTELENHSKTQKEKIENLNLELITQQILVKDLQNQLEKAKKNSQDCQNQLEKAETSLNKLENRKLIDCFVTGGICFVIGFFIGNTIHIFATSD